MMKVKILKCSYGSQSWYNDKVGETVEVTKPKNWPEYYQLKGQAVGYLISKKDAEVIN